MTYWNYIRLVLYVVPAVLLYVPAMRMSRVTLKPGRWIAYGLLLLSIAGLIQDYGMVILAIRGVTAWHNPIATLNAVLFSSAAAFLAKALNYQEE